MASMVEGFHKASALIMFQFGRRASARRRFGRCHTHHV